MSDGKAPNFNIDTEISKCQFKISVYLYTFSTLRMKRDTDSYHKGWYILFISSFKRVTCIISKKLNTTKLRNNKIWNYAFCNTFFSSWRFYLRNFCTGIFTEFLNNLRRGRTFMFNVAIIRRHYRNFNLLTPLLRL